MTPWLLHHDQGHDRGVDQNSRKGAFVTCAAPSPRLAGLDQNSTLIRLSGAAALGRTVLATTPTA